MAITALPTPPNRNDPNNFAANGDAFLGALPQFVTDANTLASNLNSLAAGGAYAIPYVVDLSSVADADPGNGKLRFDNATQNASATLRLDLLNGAGADVTSQLDTFDAAVNTVKGSLRIVKVSDPSKFLIFNVTARGAPTGYRNISVAVISSSAASPFVNGDSVILYFQRAGDAGSTGIVSSALFRETATSGSNSSTSLGAGSWVTRMLNTSSNNNIVGASLGTAASNNITLPAGTYLIDANAFAVPTQTGVFRHQIRLYNQTLGQLQDLGTSEYCDNNSNNSYPPYVGTRSFLHSYVKLTTTSNFTLDHFTQTLSASAGKPTASTGSGTYELYAEVRVLKIA